MKKNYSLGIGKFYFSVRNGGNGIMIKREKKTDAVYAYESYKKIGKECEWLGQWDGKKFVEANSDKSKKRK